MTKNELRTPALLMAERLEMNAKGFKKLGMDLEAQCCLEKAKRIKEKANATK